MPHSRQQLHPPAGERLGPSAPESRVIWLDRNPVHDDALLSSGGCLKSSRNPSDDLHPTPLHKGVTDIEKKNVGSLDYGEKYKELKKFFVIRQIS
jgi:hypothetical protein